MQIYRYTNKGGFINSFTVHKRPERAFSSTSAKSSKANTADLWQVGVHGLRDEDATEGADGRPADRPQEASHPHDVPRLPRTAEATRQYPTANRRLCTPVTSHSPIHREQVALVYALSYAKILRLQILKGEG